MIQTMAARQDMLLATADAWARTGVPLVQSAAEGFQPAGFSDDPGLYLIVPWLARTLGISVTQSADSFFIGVIALATLSGLIGTLHWTTSRIGRIYGALVVLALSVLALKIGDVYVVLFALPVAFVPWLLCLTRERTIPRSLLLLTPILGAMAAAGHTIRSHSATALVLFALTLMLSCTNASRSRRLAAVCLLIVGALVVSIPFGGLVDERDEFLVAQDHNYRPGMIAHPLWHSIYIGLGYLDNPHVAGYSDTVAAARVSELAPRAGYLTAEYESALRREVFRIAAKDPWFIVLTLLCKTAVIGIRCLVFLNVGALSLLIARPSGRTMTAFLIALSFQGVPVLLTVPRGSYALGLYTFTALFAIVCVDHAWPSVLEWWARRNANAQVDGLST